MMKKVFLVALMILMCGTAWGAPWMYSSGTQADDALIINGPGNLYGFVMATDATNACDITIYDGLTATGTVLIPTSTITSGATDRVQQYYFDPPIHFGTGCYVDIDPGVGTVGYVIYYTR